MATAFTSAAADDHIRWNATPEPTCARVDAIHDRQLADRADESWDTLDRYRRLITAADAS